MTATKLPVLLRAWQVSCRKARNEYCEGGAVSAATLGRCGADADERQVRNMGGTDSQSSRTMRPSEIGDTPDRESDNTRHRSLVKQIFTGA